jgi:pilus assembly protein FimV
VHGIWALYIRIQVGELGDYNVRILGLIVALWAAVLLPTNSFALGLGEIEVNSFLNQALDAEIQVISARPGEIDDLLVSLASREAFTRAGLARTRNLSELRFAVKKNEEGDQAVILVTTKGSVKEPFLNFLIEADWSKGRVLREFTVLLDPPFYANQPAATDIASAPVEEPVVEEASVSEVAAQSGVTPIAESSEPAQMQETVTEPMAVVEETQPESASDVYVSSETQNIAFGDVLVVKDDTLWGIASAHKDQDHSMAQVMLAFQRANPDAFNDGNINNMKVGAVLRVPSTDDLNAIGQQEAYAEVLVQNGLWDEYVTRVTGVSPAVASETGGTDMAAQEDPNEAGGELSLLLPGEGESESSGIGDTGDVDALRTRLAIAEEDLDAARIENQELESRIAELQARLSKVEELQKMVEIEDDSLAQMQADQAEQTETAEVVEQTGEQAATESVTEAIEADEEALLEELLAEEAAAQADEQAVIDGAAAESISEDTLADDAMTDETSVETAGTDEMMSDEAELEVKVQPPAPVIVSEPTRAPSIFDGILPPDIINMIPPMSGILGDPIILGAVGGFIVLLLILVVLKRRKSSADDDTEISAAGNEDLFAEDEDDELTPIHLADGGVDDGTDIVEPDETDIKIPGEDDILPAESDAEPQDDLAATAIISAVDMPEPEASAPAATGDQDDVLNEVDVYLAYGLYDNAEDLLNSSLTENTDRADYRSKLLDTYFATKNVEAFGKEAEKLKSMGDAASSYWDRVQIMGYELAPENPLFSDAKDSGLSAADLEITKPQEADFDLGASDDDDTNFSTTDFNLGEDDTGGDFSDTSNMGETGEIAETQQIPQLDELPELDDEDDTNVPAEAESETALELPDDIGDELGGDELEGDELEFSIDEEASSSDSAEVKLADELDLGSTEDETAAATDDVDLDEVSMELDTGEDEAATDDDKSEIDFDDEFDAVLEEADSLDVDDAGDISFEPDLTDSAADDLETDDDAVKPNPDSNDETGFTDTAVVSPGVDNDDSPAAGDDDDNGIDLGMEDTAMINLDNEETSLATSELNLQTSEFPIAADDDEDISIIDFGGEDFVEPTDIVESIDDVGDSTAMDANVEDDAVRTGTFAPGDFEEPTAVVGSASDIDDIGDLMLPDDVDEVSTKLDLARAFIDMGDTEGARGSLEEVLSEGNEEQKAEATALLEQI